MKKTILLLVVLICSGTGLSAFGPVGHDAIAYIAECNLTQGAKKEISRYLDRSIVYYSSWMDDVRKSPEYAYTDGWHCAYVDNDGVPCLGKNFEEGAYKGDAVLELLNVMDRLENYRELDDASVTEAIKMIVHLVADMHCPGHVLYPGQKGFNVVYRGKKVSYHSIWDDGLITAVHKWNYMEYEHQLGNLTKKQAKSVSAGGPVEWEIENASSCKIIYEWAGPDDVLGNDFSEKAKALADSQIQKAGYRLAKVLNDIFG